jgi:hypothetical protein
LIPAKSLDYDQLYKGLEVLSEFEREANSRVIDSGVLRGMNIDDIRKAGERLILQDGCRSFFQKIGETRENLNLDVHILSYCWCAELIRSAFSSGKAENPWPFFLLLDDDVHYKFPSVNLQSTSLFRPHCAFMLSV